jgi:2-alkenal reductase
MIKRFRPGVLSVTIFAVFALALAACGTSAKLTVAPAASEPAAAIVPVIAPPQSAPVVAPAVVPQAPVPSSQTAATTPDITSAEPGAAAVSAPAADVPAAPTVAVDAVAIVAAQEQVLGDIYDTALPSVVRIVVSQWVQTNSGRTLQPLGEGSGFVWSAEGHIVTNHHVIADADRVTVLFADGWEADATVLGSDPDSDLAALKIDLPDVPLTPLALGDSAALRVGQLAVAIGAPFGQDFTMTTGIVSALGRTIPSAESLFVNPQAIQTDAPINPGNSGGPLLDRLGRVIGINSQIATRSGSSAGIGFSVPINTAKRVVPELIETGSYEYAYLGISGGSLGPRLAEAKGLDETTRGVIVYQVVGDGPADRAGLVANERSVEVDGQRFPTGGDVITSIDGVKVSDMDDLLAYLAGTTRPGDAVKLGLIREDGDDVTVDVVLGRRPTA